MSLAVVTGLAELTASQCQEEADRCRALMRQVMAPAHRVVLDHIADTWERIAEDIAYERLAREG